MQDALFIGEDMGFVAEVYGSQYRNFANSSKTNYKGYLLKVSANGQSNWFEISSKCFIKADSYKVTKNVQDVDSYRDASGLLHRNAVEHYAMKVEFETPPMLTGRELAFLFENIRNKFAVKKERKLYVKMYVPEEDKYITQACYMVDPAVSFYGNYNDDIHYNAVRISFIGY